MDNHNHLDPESLASLLDDIQSGNLSPSSLNGNALIKTALLLQNAPQPKLSAEAQAGIDAALQLKSVPQPKLSAEALAGIDAALQLKNAPQPTLSAEALAGIDAALQLKSAPQPTLSAEAINNIEQQLLANQAAPKASPVLTAAAVVLVVLGVMLAGLVLLSDKADSDIPAAAQVQDVVIKEEPQIPEAALLLDEATEEATEAALPTDTPTDEPSATPSPTDEPALAQIEEAAAPTEEVTESPDEMPNLALALQLPPILVIEGVIETLNETTLVVSNFVLDFAHNPALGNGLSVGDTVYIEGIGNPFDEDTFIALTITPLDDVYARPELTSDISLASADDASTDDFGITTMMTDLASAVDVSIGSLNSYLANGSTGGSGKGTKDGAVTSSSTGTSCDDDHDRGHGNSGGNDCDNPGQGNGPPGN